MLFIQNITNIKAAKEKEEATVPAYNVFQQVK
jgi:hypothetical protein